MARFDHKLSGLLEKFVCVRLIQANSLDLGLFQFDYDLTFAAFFLNADRTVYGRFGTRASEKADQDITVEGFARALEGTLKLHAGYPGNKSALAGKQPKVAAFKVPEDYPSLKDRYTARLDFEGKLAQSCIHCHMVQEAERLWHRGQGRLIPDSVLFPWPMPEVLGSGLDPKEKARVIAVRDGSVAAKAGLRKGDELVTLEGQPLLSVADVQWVLHDAKERGTLTAQVQRGGRPVAIELTLEPGWRGRGDISWRPSSWDLRRMITGGLVLEDLPDAERKRLGLGLDSMALRVKYVGEYDEHAAGKKAGFLKEDIIVAWGPRTDRLTESGIFHYVTTEATVGGTSELTVLRSGQQQKFKLPVR